ncbi:AAA family ATPase [Marinobacter zhejiangensis]|uniref:Nicotinamide-nucleotide adenylyltransferase, NadR type n=1 Tax=Marinobacter zhejiangensis TaxID=488535 RepID=A0A1I4Q365_9GAMM|nr:AAA family ATPase [Marinobacter zhejiangensis]SFM34521.1 nicotinamide-nucleotide adenylyltransferase, NadR type [Marinobacter zhejiangensis]
MTAVPRRRGFLLGKFMPFHAGHLYLCDVAAGLVDELTVMVCTRDCEPIPGRLRFRWVSDSVKPNVRVVHLHRDIPQEPKDHPEFWPIWRRTVRELHPEPIDLVFGSEEYVHRLASELEAAPLVLDIDRITVPISATRIRQNPAANWTYLPPAVRPYYQLRVCLLGPESVGKSTLSELLAGEFQSLHIPEYGRLYDAMFKQGAGWAAEDFVQLAQGHVTLREEIVRRAGPVVFEDTDLLQTLVWAEYLLGEIPEGLRQLLEGWEPAEYYLLLRPDVSWHDDGTRYSGDDRVRQWFFERLQHWLDSLALPYRIVEGAVWDDRAAMAREAVAALLEDSRK